MLTPPQALAIGLQHHQAGDLTTAEQMYRSVLRADPCQVRALEGLALIALQQGQVAPGIDYLTRALQTNPASPSTHFHLGRALRTQGRLDEAVASYRESLRLNPNSAAAQNNLGDVLLELERWQDAAAALREAIRLKPDFAEAHNNLGLALVRLGRAEEAEACCRQALRLRPDYFPASCNLGIVFREQGHLEQAEARLREALRARPDSFPALHNLGNVLTELGRLDEAVACLRQAISLRPNDAEVRQDLGMALLLKGDWDAAWPEYQWRHKCRAAPPPPPYLPVWDGSAPLIGRTILLVDEQGLGDNIQFIRYAPLVKAQGGEVVMVCQPRLARVFATSAGIDRVATRGSDTVGPADWYVPLLDLSGIFHTTPTTIPNKVPYLGTEPQLLEAWRRELSGVSGLKIGISWQGNPKAGRDQWRSVPLTHFAPIAEVPGIRLFSLQQNAGAEQLPALATRWGITDLGSSFTDLVDTAAAIMNLDMVITTDTMIAHLSGALGARVWVALGWLGDWRWLQTREDSPWYPTMRLFRQPSHGDWPTVFARIAAALREVVASGGHQPPVATRA
jgi:tetratricopeptide (TPR) repeat protein